MRAGKHLVIGMIALFILGGVLSPGAHASRNKHRVPKTHFSHYKQGKNANLVGGKFKAPRKQHLPKGSYRDHVTGATVYGKK